MIVKYAARSSRRTLLKTLLFLLLLTLLTALLATSLGLTVSVESALRGCEEGYRTVGVAEYYTGTETVDAAQIRSAAEQLSALEFPNSVLQWNPTRQAQGSFTDIDTRISSAPVRNKAVLLLKYCKQDRGTATVFIMDRDGNLKEVPASSELPQQMLVEKAFFAEKDVESHFIDVKFDSEPFEVGHYYLVCGDFFNGNLLNHCMELEQDDPAFAPVDITSGDGYLLPDTSVFYNLAEEYEMRARSFSVYAPEQLETYLPFQQKTVELIDGRMFTPEEESAGAAVCIISRQIAETLGLSVGDVSTLSLAVRPDTPLIESYRVKDGFDLQKAYTVVGIVDYQDNWNDAVFIPVPDGIDMTCNHCSAVLGQFLLDNRLAEQFEAEAASVLPAGAQLTVYDQGYSRAVKPLQNTLRSVRIITVVCLFAGLGFLVLLGWLLVYRQRQVGGLMLRIGATRRQVYVHYLTSMALIALPAALLGAVISIALSDSAAEIVNRALAGMADTELLFSSSSLSLQQETVAVESAPRLLSVLLCCGIFVLSMLCCLLFVGKSLPKKHKTGASAHGLQKARSRSLRGGAAKYSALSVLRGGFRSAVPLLAALCATVLFCQLTSSAADCSAQLKQLEQDSEVRGYFTDYSGQKCGGVMVDMKNVYRLADSGLTDSLSVSRTFHYAFYAAVKDGALTDVSVPIIPHSEYSVPAAERRMAYEPEIILTNSIPDLPRFLYSHVPEVTWLDGYDESVLTQSYIADPRVYLVYKDGFVPPESSNPYAVSAELPSIQESDLKQRVETDIGQADALVCIAPTSLIKARGLQLGDGLVVINQIGQDYLALVRLQIVGCYEKANGKDDIIVPLSAGLDGETLEDRGTLYEEVMGLAKYTRAYCSASSAVFHIKCSHLNEAKAGLAEEGFSPPYSMDGQRIFIVLEDSAYYISRHALEQRLWYMERIFPAVYVLTEALAVILAVLQIQARKKELRLMRSLGTPAGSAFGSIWLEQLILCPLGAALGLGISRLFGSTSRFALPLTAAFAALWLIGATLAALRACSGRLLKHRKDDF